MSGRDIAVCLTPSKLNSHLIIFGINILTLFKYGTSVFCNISRRLTDSFVSMVQWRQMFRHKM
jgi:hypothetical protein